ncbi:ribosomal protein S18 acetylase RimI-like enzyme [Bacillus sp. SORGH_AS 510]|uniref:GNAT family N-acetyltransferase n=1 Tax=Bacillus sp. SORGH_AS_0510 TaxID=3041771 RepID=UPI00277D6FAD|nr:GNAT family N-acetyltransferase [Bacillus sp. SORGH_AS_0510]MDQ1143985.1 ribosomal protein S18 acetylase RimI-like enzyme [Bacillus sp. SORGH_AS_0510]
MEIRKPNDAEYKTILSLSPQALFDGTLGEAKLSDEKVKQIIEPLLQKGSYYLIATAGDHLMGWILIGTSKDPFTEKKFGFIYEFFVLEQFRGNGISKQLMETGIEHLRQDEFSEVRLSVYAGNKAIKLYEKLGFKDRTITMSMTI